MIRKYNWKMKTKSLKLIIHSSKIFFFDSFIINYADDGTYWLQV